MTTDSEFVDLEEEGDRNVFVDFVVEKLGKMDAGSFCTRFGVETVPDLVSRGRDEIIIGFGRLEIIIHEEVTIFGGDFLGD